MEEVNLEELNKKLEDFLSKPGVTETITSMLEEDKKLHTEGHLSCLQPCKYRMPKNSSDETITWCSKYSKSQEELCEKECTKRIPFIPYFKMM